MAVDVAKHMLPGSREGSNGQVIGCGPGPDKPHARLVTEDPLHGLDGRRGVLIVAVRWAVPLVGVDDRCQRLGAKSGVVITSESTHGGQCTSPHLRSRSRRGALPVTL